LALLGIPALALIGALALACFAKVAGVVFLGLPRTNAASRASEPGSGALRPMLFLASACVVLGVVPALGIAFTSAAAGELTGLQPAEVPAAVVSGAASISILALIVLATTALLLLLRSARMPHETRHEVTWACGYDAVTPRMQYTGSSFAAPLVAIFGRFSGTRVERSAEALHTQPFDLVLDGFVFPLGRALHRAALRLRPIQQGRLHVYLLYVLAALLVLLGYLTFGSRP
jgi:NADH:ubiquinone oxidoreductase subunit 5 (subunit L)/multisubunit Na+/H+ antiporter MnhA subunit